jgi:hypothetical protein
MNILPNVTLFRGCKVSKKIVEELELDLEGFKKALALL